MPVSIKQMTINTKVNKKGGADNAEKKQGGGGGGMSKLDKEALIEECMARVRAMIEYELKP